MRGGRRAVIAMVWLLGTGAATAITIEGVRVVGSNVINGESAISPRQANAALSGRTTTTPEPPVTTVAATTTLTTAAPTTTTTEAPTTVPETVAVTTATTKKAGPTTTKKKPVTTSTTKKPIVTTVPVTPAPTVTTPAPSPTTATPTTQPPPPTTPPTTAPSSQCIQQTRVTEGGFVSACFTAQKVSILSFVAYNGWRPEQQSSGQVAIVRFIKSSRVITVVASWSGGPQWSVSDTG